MTAPVPPLTQTCGGCNGNGCLVDEDPEYSGPVPTCPECRGDGCVPVACAGCLGAHAAIVDEGEPVCDRCFQVRSAE